MALRNFFSILVKPKDKVLSQRCRPDVRGVTVAVSALRELRNNPEEAMGKYDYYLDTENRAIKFSGREERNPNPIGGQVTITECPTENDVTRLKITAAQGTDWYFPYISAGFLDGVGEVAVPINQPNGTIVITGGMNGCSLQVNKDEKYYYFYHDANGISLDKRGKLPGKIVCRIDAPSYFDGDYINSRMSEPPTPWLPAFQMIFIRSSGQWNAMCSGIKTGNEGKPIGSLRPLKRDVATHCLKTFI